MENTINAEVGMEERIIAPMASSPFANLEESRIINACKRDRDFQDNIAREHNKAHEIIKMYYDGSIDFEEAITLLITKCRRNRACAILNIQNSSQRFVLA
jgi:hypothetical protein